MALGLLACVVALSLAPGLRRGGDAGGLAAAPPYAIPSASARTLEGQRWDPARDVQGPSALVYVSDRCPFCRAELGHWAALADEGEGTTLWIVASPTSAVEALGWVPAALRKRVVWDAEGAVAASLGVQGVPATLWIDSAGIVREQRLGASSPGVIREESRRLAGSGVREERRLGAPDSPAYPGAGS